MNATRKRASRRDPSYYDWGYQEVADYLGVHWTSVYRWCRLEKRPLPHGRVGRSYRFKSEDVKRWFRQNESAR